MALEILLDVERGLPVYRQIYEGIASALAAGGLQPDEQLPTIHELAQKLSVHPNTVARAYRELERDGLITARRGRGSFPVDREPPPGQRDALARDIARRALTEAARHGISSDELVDALKTTGTSLPPSSISED